VLLQVGYYAESKERGAFIFRVNHSGIPNIQEDTNLVSLAVNLRTTRFNVNKFYVLLRQCFVWISKQTAAFTFYSIHWLVFTTELKSVYCAGQAACLSRADRASPSKG
jgi:hypothetical protein